MIKTIVILLISLSSSINSFRGNKLKSEAQIYIDNIPLEDEMKQHKITPPKEKENVKKLREFYENEKKDKKAALLKILKENPGAVKVKCDKDGNPLTMLADITHLNNQESQMNEKEENTLIKFKEWLEHKYQLLDKNHNILKQFLEKEKNEKENIKETLSKNDLKRLKIILKKQLKKKVMEKEMSIEENKLYYKMIEEHLEDHKEHSPDCPIVTLSLRLAGMIN